MNQLVIGESFGNINFGVPEDLDPTHKPWAFYELLGVNRDASTEEIKKAFREQAQRLHPDKGGDAEAFKRLDTIVQTLLDDGGALGAEHSARARYDRISGLEQHFSGYIRLGDFRTIKLSEIMLMLMEKERHQAEVESKIGDKLPKYEALKAQMNTAASVEEAIRIEEQMKAMEFEAMDFVPEVVELKMQSWRDAMQRHRTATKQFASSYQTSAYKYKSKILDIVYFGPGTVIFGTANNMILGLLGHEINDTVLTLFLGRDNYIAVFLKSILRQSKEMFFCRMHI